MVRRLGKLTATATFLTMAATSALLIAQEPNRPVPLNPPSPPRPPQGPAEAPPVPPPGPEMKAEKAVEKPKLNKLDKRPDEFEDARRIFDQLSPEQRQRFRENLERWRNLPPDERETLRDQEKIRREKIAREINETLKKAGLNLDSDRREVFALRYSQERRKIEQQLRQEMEAKRQTMMRETMERLKNEFKPFSTSPSPSPSPSATPSASATP